MEEQRLTAALQDCAERFYQNRERTGYETLTGLLPELNGRLTELSGLLLGLPDGEGTEMQRKVLADLRELVTAYQCRDGLALADLLCYDIPRELDLLEELKQGEVQ